MGSGGLYRKYMLRFPEENGWKMFGNPAQKKVQDMGELSEEIMRNDGVNGCYLSICNYFYGGMNKVVSIPFDFDSKGDSSKMDARRDAVKLVNLFLDREVKPFSLLDSGNGYHIHLYISPRSFLKNELMEYQEMLTKGVELSTVDRTCLGQPNRLMRIPWTYNVSAEQNCFPVFESRDSELMELPRLNPSTTNGGFTDGEVEIDNGYSGFPPYSCLKELANQSEPPHLVRVFFTVLLQKQGLTKSECFEELKELGWNDFDPSRTRYQIDYIYGRSLNLPSCGTLKQWGFCTDNCYLKRKHQ